MPHILDSMQIYLRNTRNTRLYLGKHAQLWYCTRKSAFIVIFIQTNYPKDNYDQISCKYCIIFMERRKRWNRVVWQRANVSYEIDRPLVDLGLFENFERWIFFWRMAYGLKTLVAAIIEVYILNLWTSFIYFWKFDSSDNKVNFFWRFQTGTEV